VIGEEKILKEKKIRRKEGVSGSIDPVFVMSPIVCCCFVCFVPIWVVYVLFMLFTAFS